MARAPYRLSAVLYGHSLDVRAVAVSQDSFIVSGSRDRSAKVWRPNGINTGYSEVQCLEGHTNFVSCLCILPPDPQHRGGLIVTGSNDTVIRVFLPDSPQPVQILKGHTDSVCSLSPGIKQNTVVSSSWDMTARLWKIDGSTVPPLTVTGHQMAIWTAIQLAAGSIVTGSADKTIKIWLQDGIYQKTLTGHKDCVRGLAATSANEFLSCSNDATVRHWNATTGTCLATLYGHSHYIYSLSVLPNGGVHGFVTSGEDRTLRIWQYGKVEQTLMLPTQSVWSVACLANGDIVAGSSDGVVRVFSSDPSRQAEPELLKQFEEAVANTSLSAEQQLGGIDISNLPGMDALAEPGRTDGQTKLVRDGTSVLCYSWSAAAGQWEKVGDVMGASGGTQATSGKQLYEGKEYDYVFSVDIEDGKPPLKLPYNMSEDPWFVAQAFINKNNLSPLYLDQVADFIMKNSSSKEQAPAPASYCDPFTGGNRYIPGTSASGEIVGNTTDPFTGSSRYMPASAWSGSPDAKTDAATDTGSSSHVTGGERSQADGCPVTPYFPQKSYIRFDQANPKMILEKLLELNRKSGDGSHKIEESYLEGVVKLGGLGATTNPLSMQVLKQLLEWPPDIIFPVLDVTRLAVRNAGINAELCSGPTGDKLMGLLRNFLLPHAVTANQMLSLRIICNMVVHPDGEQLALRHRDYLLSAMLDFVPPFNKQVQVAVGTLLLNLAVAFSRTKDTRMSSRVRAVSVTVAMLLRLTELEAQFRTLVALGTLLWDWQDVDSPVNMMEPAALLEELRKFLRKLAVLDVDTDSQQQQQQALAKVSQCAAQVLALLQQ